MKIFFVRLGRVVLYFFGLFLTVVALRSTFIWLGEVSPDLQTAVAAWIGACICFAIAAPTWQERMEHARRKRQRDVV